MIKKIFLILSMTFLGSCGPSIREVQPFTAGNPIQVKASVIEPVIQSPVTVADRKGASHINKGFEEALYLWVASTFVPQDKGGTFFITFEKAHIKETSVIPKKLGLKGLFTKEPVAKLEGKIVVHLELRDVQGGSQGTGHFTLERSTTLLENTTLAERDQKITQLYHDLIVDLDKRVRTAMEEGIPGFTY